MLHIAICDDNSDQLTVILSAAKIYFSTHPDCEVQISQFDNPLHLLESLEKTGGWDIVLLDICMPGILGIDVAKEIRDRRDRTEIIFLTTSNEYAIDAFALKAAHYLLKPFSQMQFNEAMDRTMARFSSTSTKNLVIKPEGGGARLVDIDEILYIESRGHLLTIYTKSGPCTEGQRSLSGFLKELESLSPGQFITPYKGYIVNQKAIRIIQPEQIILHSGEQIPIPKRGFRELKNTYFDYIFAQSKEQLCLHHCNTPTCQLNFLVEHTS